MNPEIDTQPNSDFTDKPERRGWKFPHNVIVKAPGLLPMNYKVRELANKLIVPQRTLRDWLGKGAPHHRDARNHIWINGVEFSRWVLEHKKSKSKRKLKDHEAYCFKYKSPVELIDPEITPLKGKLIRIKGICSICETTIVRGGRNASSN